jgi:branched-chain amino acid transport system substrate-binding protein
MRSIKFLIKAGFKFVMAVFFLVTVSSAQEKENKGEVKIGLLISDSTSTAAKFGAELAIRRANENNGINGLPVKLVTGSMEGPWGTGSNQAVTMIFKDDVLAIIGSHDGRNAHLVEQVTAKSKVVFISAWTSDPTLSQAFVPWFFNCVPNDLQQSDALIEEIFNKRKLTGIAVIADNGYDSKSTLNNFLKELKNKNMPEPLQFTFDKITEIPELADRINSTGIGCIILFVQPPASLRLAELLRLKHMNTTVFGSLALMDENKIPNRNLKQYENMIIVSSGNPGNRKFISFSEEYTKTFGISPGPVAMYAFDGMNMLIEAIRKSGSDREMIQRSLADIIYEGVTGVIQFDDKGNRKGIPGFVEIKNGNLVLVER